VNFNKQVAVPVSPKIEYNFFIHNQTILKK